MHCLLEVTTCTVLQGYLACQGCKPCTRAAETEEPRLQLLAGTEPRWDEPDVE